MNIYHARQELRTKSIYDLPLRVVYYARVSTDKEEQKSSIVNQRQHFEEFIRGNKNWKFFGGYIDDGISGMHAEKREEFQRMISDAKAGKFDFILTKEIPRFARNTLDSIQYSRQLLSYGVCIWFQNDGINTIDEDSEFRLTIMSGVAQDEIRKLSSRVKFGHAQAIKRGVVLGNSMIYGYEKQHVKLVINPEEAEMVRLIFEKYATGTWSTPKIEKLLYDNGYRNHKGEKISRGVIRNIIKNPKYKGYYVGGKVKVIDMFTKKQEFLPESEWNMFRDDGSRVPAIVDEETWERANKIFARRGNAIKERRTAFKTDNLFTGIIFCGDDGAPYWMKQHYVRGTEDVKWVCSYRIKNGAKSCNSFGLAESELKEIVASIINLTEINVEKCVQTYMDIFRNVISDDCKSGPNIKNIETQIESIKEKMAKLLDYNLNGFISDNEFIRKNQECKEKLSALTEKISNVPPEKDTAKDLETKLRRISKELERYKGVKADDIELSIIHNLIEKIIVYPIDFASKKAKLEVHLKNGETQELQYGRSGNIMKKMIEAQEKKMAGK